MTERSIGEINYLCVNCSSVVTTEQLQLMLEVKCPNCGYRVLRKTRPPIVKRVKAR